MYIVYGPPPHYYTHLTASFPSDQTCIIRAWYPKLPLLNCPAMNTHMWDHPLTFSHLRSLTDFGYIQVPLVTKLLACGDQSKCFAVGNLNSYLP